MSLSEVDSLLSAAPTAESLLNLNQLVQHKHLALANRVWPNCTWLDWDLPQIEQHRVIKLILRVFGHDLLDYVIQTFGRDVVLEYWRELKVPDEYDDIHLEEEDLSPVLNVPDEQMVDNPHSDFEADEGEFFIFGAPETVECFRWLIESRSHYSLYVDNRTGYVNDPMGIRLAYDMRNALKRDYWATLPPDTLPAYLAIAHSLQWATVPEAWEEGRLPPVPATLVIRANLKHCEVMEEDARSPDTISFSLSVLTDIDPRLRDKPTDVCLETGRDLKKLGCLAMITRFPDNYHRAAKLAKNGTTLTHFARS